MEGDHYRGHLGGYSGFSLDYSSYRVQGLPILGLVTLNGKP